MADATIAATMASSYARAIFEKAVEKYARDLHALQAAVSQSNLLTRLDNPAEAFDAKKALLNGMLPQDADPEVRNLAYLLASKNQMHLVSLIVGDFDRMVARDKLGAVAQVTSAVELTGDEKAKLETKLREQYGQEVGFEYNLAPSLLGGVVIRVGDAVFDGSVTGKLAAMKQKLQTAR